jgi:hypothetical protein
MKAHKSLTMLGSLALAGLAMGMAADRAEAQCYTTSYVVGSPVYVTPAPVYVAPAPVVVQTPVVYHAPVRYVTTHVGYSGGYRRVHHYYSHHRHSHYRHHGHRGSSWGFGFHYGRH